MSQTQELRGLAFAVDYRMLGSVAEAEDVTQEALLRLHDASGVENPEAFLTTVTTRLAIDVLRSARVRRETYTGSWLPEPLFAAEQTAGLVRALPVREMAMHRRFFVFRRRRNCTPPPVIRFLEALRSVQV